MAKSDLTPKQEAFALAYIETGNASEAYRRSYSAGSMSQQAIEVEACRLLAHPKVALRIAASKRAAAKKHEVTVDSLTTMLRSAYRKAKGDDKGAAAMVQAALGLGKLHGLIVDKKHVESNNKHSHTVDPVSTFDGFLAEAARGRAEVDTEDSVPN